MVKVRCPGQIHLEDKYPEVDSWAKTETGQNVTGAWRILAQGIV